MSKKIMVVDDEGDTLILVKAILEGADFEATCFDSSKVALEEIKSGRIFPDLILLDMRIPEISGPDFCREVKKDERFKDLKIVFFTASSELDKSLAQSSGALGFIFKPFDNDKLIKDICLYLEM